MWRTNTKCMEKILAERVFDFFYNEQFKLKFERIILYVAGIGFLIHLLLIFIFNIGGFQLIQNMKLILEIQSRQFTHRSLLFSFMRFIYWFIICQNLFRYLSQSNLKSYH